jgi:hypothetical protein
MKPTFAVLGIALSLSVALMVVLPTSVLYPRFCDTYPSPNGVPIQPGTWCIDYDPELGRYGDPPRDVPADMSRAATVTAHPNVIRFGIGAAAFVLVSVAGWSILRRRSRDLPRR